LCDLRSSCAAALTRIQVAASDVAFWQILLQKSVEDFREQ
jgi:hypothetical protein